MWDRVEWSSTDPHCIAAIDTGSRRSIETPQWGEQQLPEIPCPWPQSSTCWPPSESSQIHPPNCAAIHLWCHTPRSCSDLDSFAAEWLLQQAYFSAVWATLKFHLVFLSCMWGLGFFNFRKIFYLCSSFWIVLYIFDLICVFAKWSAQNEKW